MRDPPSGRRRMGACETTPTTTRPGKPAQRPFPRPTRRRLFLASDRRPPLAGIKLVRPRPRLPGAALRALQLDPGLARRHKPAATRKATTKVPPQPRRPRTGHRVYPARPLDSWGPYGCEDAASRVHPRQCQAVDIAVSGTDKLEVLWISYMWSI